MTTLRLWSIKLSIVRIRYLQNHFNLITLHWLTRSALKFTTRKTNYTHMYFHHLSELLFNLNFLFSSFFSSPFPLLSSFFSTISSLNALINEGTLSENFLSTVCLYRHFIQNGHWFFFYSPLNFPANNHLDTTRIKMPRKCIINLISENNIRKWYRVKLFISERT